MGSPRNKKVLPADEAETKEEATKRRLKVLEEILEKDQRVNHYESPYRDDSSVLPSKRYYG